MEDKPKRLKKHISFSAHEKDIYDYLEKQGNASAFIKRLILNNMIMEQTGVAPVVIQTDKNEQKNEKPKEPEKPKLTPDELENMELAMKLDL